MSFFVEFDPNKRRDKDIVLKDLQIFIRDAIVEDATFLAQISCDREGKMDNFDFYISFWRNKLKSRGDNSFDKTFIAVAKDRNGEERSIGYSNIEYKTFSDQRDENGNHYTAPEGWYLLGIIVYPKYRRLGIGSILIDKRVEWAKQHYNESKIYFYTNPRNLTSMAFHKYSGFRKMEGEYTFPKRATFKTIFFEKEL